MKKIILSLIILFMAVTGAFALIPGVKPIAVAQATNQLTNPGFENQLNNWTCAQFGSTDSASCAPNTSQKRTGTYSAAIVIPASQSYTTTLSQSTSLTGGLCMSAWIKTAFGDPTVNFIFGDAGITGTPGITANGWTQITGTISSTSGDRVFRLQVWRGSAVASAVYIDDVVLWSGSCASLSPAPTSTPTPILPTATPTPYPTPTPDPARPFTISNAGFENQLTSWTCISPNIPAGYTCQATSSYHSQGSWAATIRKPTAHANGANASTPWPRLEQRATGVARGGDSFCISADVGLAMGGGDPIALIQIRTNGTARQVARQHGGFGANLVQLEGSVTIPAGQPDSAIDVILGAETWSGGELIFDNIQVRREVCNYIPPPPPTPTPQVITSSSGALDSGNNLTEAVYTVEYNNLPAGYRLTRPLNGPPPSYTITLGSGCSTQTNGNYLCDASGNAYDVFFGVNNSTPWMQCVGGSCRNDNGFTNSIPSSAVAACGGPNSAVARAPSNTPGIIYSGDASYSFGTGQASPDPYNWVVGGTSAPFSDNFSPVTSGIVRTSYDYFITTARQSGITITDLTNVHCGAGGIGNCNLSASLAKGIYRANGNLVINSTSPTSTFTTGSYIILVNGDLTIQRNIKVNAPSTVTFSAKGDISIDQNVGEASIYSYVANIEGFYSADSDFIIQGINNCSTGADKRFNLGGSVVVNAGLQGGTFQNNRNLCAGNIECPSVSLIERPDFVLNSPQFIKSPTFIWQEVAP